MTSNDPSPEYLDSGSGRPLPARRRAPWVAAGAVVALGVVGGGAWAAWSFLAAGPQPAEALPGSTLAYASVDLDPSGGQKIEALRTLRKFPAFEDHVGLDTDDDVRERIFEEVEKACPDLDDGRDVEPWLGDRLAVAAVDAGGETPEAVFVLQVTDDDAADTGLQAIKECSGGDEGAWHIGDGWALVGSSQEVVDGVADDAADDPLSEDDDFSRWTDEAGDAGIATAYLAPEAGDALAEHAEEWFGSGLPTAYTEAPSDSDTCAAPCSGGAVTGPGLPPELLSSLKDFEGMAATLRFDDGALELEVAGDAGASSSSVQGLQDASEVVESLPEDTAAALGVGFADGWFGDLVDQVAASMGGGMTAEDLMDELSAQTGLDLPGDAEALAGDAAALAVGPDFDPEAFFASEDGSGIPVGVKLQGDPDGIDPVLDRLRARLGPAASLLGSDAEGDEVAVGPDADYRRQLLEGGDLGGSEVFRAAVPDADRAAAILFVDFDAGGGWVQRAAGEEDPEVGRNLEPLSGLGLSAWLDDDVSHLVLRVTTD